MIWRIRPCTLRGKRNVLDQFIPLHFYGAKKGLFGLDSKIAEYKVGHTPGVQIGFH